MISSFKKSTPHEITIGTTIKTLDRNSIKIKCPTTGFPEPTIQWKKDRAPLELDARVTVDADGALIIKRSRASDSGRYQCLASNIGGSDSESSRVFLLGLYFVSSFFCFANYILQMNCCSIVRIQSHEFVSLCCLYLIQSCSYRKTLVIFVNNYLKTDLIKTYFQQQEPVALAFIDFNPIPPGEGGGGAESARADFNFRELS